MVERGDGVAAPNQKQGQKQQNQQQNQQPQHTKSRSSRTTTAFTHKLVNFSARILRKT